jgi:tetratricopeptide (TPR) repeat protein
VGTIDYDAIVERYRKLLQDDPENPARYYLLGHFLTIMPERAFKNIPNPKEEAVKLLETAKEKNPDNVDIRKELALCYAQLGRIDDVIKEYTELIEIAPDDVEIYHKLGDIYFVNQDWEKAIATYKKIVDFSPEDGLARRKIIDSYYKMYEKDENRASKYFAVLSEYKNKALEENPSDAMAHYELGYAYVKLSSSFILTSEEKNNSILEFKQAISIDPDNLWPYWGLKMVYNKESIDGEHMHNEAISICKEALAKDPKNPRAHFELAEAYNDNYEKDMRREAISEYKKAIELDPNFVEAHYKLASIYRVKGMYDEAIEEYNIVIELDPIGLYKKDAKRSLIHIEKSREASESRITHI